MKRLKCQLICPIGSHQPIELTDGHTVTVGRSKDTQITDCKVSKNHAELTANFEKLEVQVKATGSYPCEVDGRQLSKGEMAILRDRGSILLLPGKFENIVQFIGNNILGKRCAGMNEGSSFGAEGSNTGSGPTKQKQAKLNFNKQVDVSNADHSDSEHLEDVSKRLQKLRENAKVEAISSEGNEAEVAMNVRTSFQAENSSERMLKGSKPAENSVWMEHDRLLMYTAKGVLSSSKVASYDMDGTIITTQSGKVFPTSYSDWKILYAEIPGKLKQLFSSGFKIVFFSNQMGIQKGRVKPDEFKLKVENIINKLGIPVQMFIATGSGIYRKPALGMWTHLVEQANDNIPIDLSSSFFVGDAAGRAKDWMPGKKKDFSCSDRMFALNIGINFYTPEVHFLGQKDVKFEMPSFDPRHLTNSVSLLDPESAKITLDVQEVIVFVGSPAAGKSLFVRKHLVPHGYVHINRDVLKTWQKCVKATEEAVKQGKSVAIDNTNPDIESRQRYVAVAKAAGITCRCFVMNISLDHAHHNERFRELTDKSHQVINDMVFNTYRSKFQEPTLNEGFKEIIRVNFVPEFNSPNMKSLYQNFLVEK